VKISRALFSVLSAAVFVMGLSASGTAVETYDSMARRDPFVPLIGVSSDGVKQGLESILSVEDVSLQGILIGAGGKKSVIINGEVVDQGYKAGIFSVEHISDNDVTIKIGDDIYEVKLYDRE